MDIIGVLCEHGPSIGMTEGRGGAEEGTSFFGGGAHCWDLQKKDVCCEMIDTRCVECWAYSVLVV